MSRLIGDGDIQPPGGGGGGSSSSIDLEAGRLTEEDVAEGVNFVRGLLNDLREELLSISRDDVEVSSSSSSRQ